MCLLAAANWQQIIECFVWCLLPSGKNNLNALKN
jgi:hypothetical protein